MTELENSQELEEIDCPICTFQTNDVEEAKNHVDEHIIDLDAFVQSVRDLSDD